MTSLATLRVDTRLIFGEPEFIASREDGRLFLVQTVYFDREPFAEIVRGSPRVLPRNVHEPLGHQVNFGEVSGGVLRQYHAVSYFEAVEIICNRLLPQLHSEG